MRIFTDKEWAELVKEDKHRTQLYFRNYDPIRGDRTQEVVQRKRFMMEGEEYYIPLQMWEDPFVKEYRKVGGSASALLTATGMEDTRDAVESILNKLIQLRFKYDFEFYAAMCIHIQDKETKRYIPLVVNEGQRIILKQFEEMRLANKPIRLLLVKARQYGGSTVIQSYMFWLQDQWYENWHSCIVALNQTQSVHIRTMMKNIVRLLPDYHEPRSFRRYEGQELMRYIPERGCTVQVGSSTKPDAIRSFDLSMIHMSEVGLWKDTKEVKGDDTAQSLYSTVPDRPGTVIVMESTAKGIGNFFHRQYLNALDNKENHRDGIQPVFVPWFVHMLNLKRVPDYDVFVKQQMTDYNWWQWEQGATISGIYWYNQYKKSQHWTDFQMKSEYPTTAEEAFQSKSGRYFSDEDLSWLKRFIKDPKFIGEIRGASPVGPAALDNIRLIANDSIDNPLKIWITPEDGVPVEKKVINRFIVTVDVGGRGYKADWSVISVFDRLSTAMDFGALERAALWRGHVDPDILAYKAAQIATYYDDALLVIESNTYETKNRKTDEAKEGDHTYTVLDTLGGLYDNLYLRRTKPDNTRDAPTRHIGWHMNKQTKYQAYDDYSIRIREGDYMEYAREAANEAEWLLNTTDGKIEAMEGTHDDIQDTTAVANYISFGSMPAVKITDKAPTKSAPSVINSAGGGEAIF